MRYVGLVPLIALMGFAAACDGEKEPRQNATSTASPTPSVDQSRAATPASSTSCPLDRDICGQGENAFLLIRGFSMNALFHEKAVQLPLRDLGGADGPLPPANIVQILEKWIARADPSRSDGHGAGEVRIDAVGCRKDEPACETERAVVLTMLPVDAPTQRQAIVLVFRGRNLWVERMEQGAYNDLSKTDFDFRSYRYEEGPKLVVSPVGGRCPVEQQICDFAREVAATVRRGDVDALIDRALPRSYRCGDLSFADDVCAGASPDAQVLALTVGGRSGEGGIFSPDRFREMLAERVAAGAAAAGAPDPYGPASLELAGIACFRLGSEPSKCPSHVEVNLTWREPARFAADRRVLSLHYEWFDGGLVFRGFSDRSVISGQEFALYGGSFPASYTEGQVGELTWFAWRPAE